MFVEGELADPYRESNSEKDESDLRQENASSDSNFFTEKQNYDDYYNKFNFDNFFLLYEGEQHAQETIIVINRLIKNIDDTLYSKPDVVLNNFGLSQNTVTAADLENYKAVLKQAKSALGASGSNVSFEYNALKTMANKVIITKK